MPFPLPSPPVPRTGESGCRRPWAARAVALLWLVAAASAAAAPAGAPIVEYARDPATPVVSFRETLAGIAAADSGPSLTLYGDGRMVVHFPAYMKRHGDYERRLGESELRQLLVQLIDTGVLAFDAPATHAAKRAANAERTAAATSGAGDVQRFLSSDPSRTDIEITLVRYQPAAGRSELRNVRKTIAWVDARGDAERYPTVGALRDLAAAEATLRALMQHPDLTKIR